MNNFFQKLKQEALHLRLSHDEKQRMRLALYDAMAPAPTAVQEVRVVRAVHSSYVWFSFISSPRFALPVAVLLVLGLGSGTAFAARGSLPGDILYPIKINVNERVEVALASTPAAKAVTEEKIAGRRVDEAQTLAAQGRLDATTTQELEDNFDEHASRALALTAEGSTATTSATTATTTAPNATTPETVTAPPRGEKDLHQTPRVGALRFASTTSATTSNEAEAPSPLMQNAERDLSASLQKQRNIFNDLKQRFSKHERGDTTNNRSNQNNDQGGAQNNNQNDTQNSNQNNNQNSSYNSDTQDSQGSNRGE